ncbi:MAG: TVP38/TMEM64 family protein [Candidatus Binataceae bacterium]
MSTVGRTLAQLNRRLRRPKLLAGIIAIVAIALVVKHLGSKALVESILAWIASLGPRAPIAFVGAYIAAAVLFIPGAILTISAGFLFGLIHGTIYVSIGATLGATAAFLIGRYVARDWVARKLDGSSKFKAIDQAVAREGWKIVGLARLSPIFPFNLLNYAFGLTDIPLKDYFLASWAGMVPGIVMYVYIGTLAGDLARAESGGTTSNAPVWPVEIAGLIATVAVVIYVTYVARKALGQRTP